MNKRNFELIEIIFPKEAGRSFEGKEKIAPTENPLTPSKISRNQVKVTTFSFHSMALLIFNVKLSL